MEREQRKNYKGRATKRETKQMEKRGGKEDGIPDQ
jgi:hypothetical protein